MVMQGFLAMPIACSIAPPRPPRNKSASPVPSCSAPETAASVAADVTEPKTLAEFFSTPSHLRI